MASDVISSEMGFPGRGILAFIPLSLWKGRRGGMEWRAFASLASEWIDARDEAASSSSFIQSVSSNLSIS